VLKNYSLSSKSPLL